MLFSSTLLALRALLVLLCLRNVKAQSYTLADAYMPSNFFDMFDFYTGGDPTSGFVQYVNRSYAQSQGLVATYSDHVTIGVDHTNIYSSASPGRPSVRLTGIPVYTHGLYILSLSHMPYGCGTWPAFWSLGPDWPSHGEIDIIEGVNTNSRNLMSLHTSANCTTAGANQTGTLETSDCFIGDSNTGCGGYSASLSSYGSGFNNAGGGVYAMEWTSDHIRIWFFRRTAIPASITAGNPDPAADFGKPSANFQGSCDIDSHFGDHNIILDNTFCGDFAGNSYGSTSCPMTSGLTGKQSCQEYVAKNPSAFTEAYWSINYLKVFQLSNPSEITSSSVSLSSVTPVASTASVSSLDVALGVDSSNTVLVSQTLSLPSTGEVTATVSSQSTYFGPNTVTGKRLNHCQDDDTHTSSSKQFEFISLVDYLFGQPEYIYHNISFVRIVGLSNLCPSTPEQFVKGIVFVQQSQLLHSDAIVVTPYVFVSSPAVESCKHATKPKFLHEYSVICV